MGGPHVFLFLGSVGTKIFLSPSCLEATFFPVRRFGVVPGGCSSIERERSKILFVISFFRIKSWEE